MHTDLNIYHCMYPCFQALEWKCFFQMYNVGHTSELAFKFSICLQLTQKEVIFKVKNSH